MKSLLLLALTAPAFASYDRAPRETGHLPTAEYSLRVQLTGDYAFLANDAGGLVSVNIADNEAPQELHTFPGTTGTSIGRTYDLDLAGTDVFLAAGVTGLVIVDASDPTLMVEKSRLNFPLTPSPGNATALGVTVNGNYAYVCTASRGLKVVDITNRSLPLQVGGYQSAAPVRGSYQIAIRGTLAAVANHLDGVRLLDLTNPAAPVFLSQYDTPGRTYSVGFSGNYLFAADGTNGLLVLSVSNPAAPVLVTSVPMPGSGAGHLQIEGNLVHVSTYEGGLISLDITDPAEPEVVAKCYTEGTPDGFGLTPGIEGAFVRNGLAYTAWGSDNLRIYDLSVASRLQKYETHDAGPATLDVASSGTTLFAALGATGVRIFNAVAPTFLDTRFTLDTAGSARAVAASGTRLLIADDTAGVLLVDAANPAAPVILGAFDTSGNAQDVAFHGASALVADGSAGLRIIDFTNPAAPVLTGTLPLAAGALKVAVHGTTACVGTGGGVEIVNLTNPAAPVSAGSVPLPKPAADVLVWDANTLCIAAGESGVHIIDVTNPAVALTHSVFEPGVAQSLARQGNYLLCGTLENGIAVANLTNLTGPAYYTLNNLVAAAALSTSGDLVFAAEGTFAGTGPIEHLAALRFFLPNTPATLGSPFLFPVSPINPNPSLGLVFSALPGSTCKVRRSPDLTTWTDWQTLTAGRDPALLLDALSGPARYYRLETP